MFGAACISYCALTDFCKVQHCDWSNNDDFGNRLLRRNVRMNYGLPSTMSHGRLQQPEWIFFFSPKCFVICQNGKEMELKEEQQFDRTMKCMLNNDFILDVISYCDAQV